jgi:glycyl-tRNA synthetase beta subunit
MKKKNVPELVSLKERVLELTSFWIAGLCPTNSTDSSAIYKLTIGVADCLNFKGLVFKKFSIFGSVFFT